MSYEPVAASHKLNQDTGSISNPIDLQLKDARPTHSSRNYDDPSVRDFSAPDYPVRDSRCAKVSKMAEMNVSNNSHSRFQVWTRGGKSISGASNR